MFSSSRFELLGGSAVNTAVVLTRLGIGSAVMGAVGDDDAGRRALHMLGMVGVATELVHVSESHPTAMNTILVTPDRERTMIGARGANVHYTSDPGWHQDVDWLHLSGYALMRGPQRASAIDAVETAATAGLSVSLDVPVGIGSMIRHLVLERLNRFDVITGSRRALEELAGSEDPLDELAPGPRLVAMTSGADEVLLAGSGEEVRVTPPSVDVVDVTGAGDAFAAGLIAGELAGLGLGPTAVLAAATGAAATLVSGASETLADPATRALLFEVDRWTADTESRWLEQARPLLTIS